MARNDTRPIVMSCYVPFADDPKFRVCQWHCCRPIKTALFEHVKHPEDQELITPNMSKGQKPWRITHFQNGIPTGHTDQATCEDVVQSLPGSARQWRLKKVVAADHAGKVLLGRGRRRRRKARRG